MFFYFRSLNQELIWHSDVSWIGFASAKIDTCLKEQKREATHLYKNMFLSTV